MGRRAWTAEEDRLLTEALDVHGYPQRDDDNSWKVIAAEVPGRTNKMCRKRWLHTLSPLIKKSAWTAAEDRKLTDLYRIHGPKWALIAKSIDGRTDDACAKRYKEALDPNLKTDPWDDAEDAKLLELHGRLGGKWGKIGQEMNRGGLGCRNRWRLLERRRLALEKQPDSSLHASGNAASGPSRLSVPGPVASSSLSAIEPLWSQYPPFIDPGPSTSTSQNSLTNAPLPARMSAGQSSVRLPMPPAGPLSMAMSDPITSIRSLPPLSPMHDASGYDSEPDMMLSPMASQQLFLPTDGSQFNEDAMDIVSPIFDPKDLPPLPEDPVDFWNMAFSQPDPATQASRPPIIIPPTESSFDFDGANLWPSGSHLQQPSPAETNDSSSAMSTPLNTFNSALSPGPSPLSRPSSELPGSDPEGAPSVLFSRHIRATVVAPPRPSEKAKRKPKPPKLSRLSQKLPLSEDPSIRPYACGRPPCWSEASKSSSALFATAQELSAHIKTRHGNEGPCDKPFRCGLPKCHKAWKNLNGLQYHLQVSPEHFRNALSSRFSQAVLLPRSPRSQTGRASPAPTSDSEEDELDEDDRTRYYECPYPDCFKTFKSAGGLKYHVEHGHRQEQPIQLDDVPPALAREIHARTKKMKKKVNLPSSIHSSPQLGPVD